MAHGQRLQGQMLPGDACDPYVAHLRATRFRDESICSMSHFVRADPGIKHHLDDLVTRHMRLDFCRIDVNQTVGEALAAIRRQPPEGRVIYFYVVDDQNRLQGVVPTRRLLLNPLDKKVADIMVREVIAISHRATVLEACEFFTLHRLLAFPVVDEDRRIIGVVDVELYTTELSELDRSERNDYLFQLVGVHLTEAQQSAPLIAFCSRFPWLLCNIGAGILAAFLSGVFEDELQRVVALALFIPVVLALAESVSIQSVSLALQILHGHQPTWASILRRLRSEVLLGSLLGVASGLLVAVVAFVWLGQASIFLCVLGGIAGGVAGAAVIGMAIPNLLHRLKLDPQVAAGPIALAASDMVTLLIYFNLARWLLG
jgi:magnesium transporter